MYTISALWSYAREQADITTIICDNGSYAILQHELERVGAASDGERAGKLLDLGGPALDFVALATGMGVPATRATTAEELTEQFRTALAEPGPHLIDAVLPRQLTPPPSGGLMDATGPTRGRGDEAADHLRARLRRGHRRHRPGRRRPVLRLQRGVGARPRRRGRPAALPPVREPDAAAHAGRTRRRRG